MDKVSINMEKCEEKLGIYSILYFTVISNKKFWKNMMKKPRIQYLEPRTIYLSIVFNVQYVYYSGHIFYTSPVYTVYTSLFSIKSLI